MSPRPCYRLTLADARPERPAGVPAPVRLRRALKALLRSYGLRVLAVEQLPAGVPAPVPPRAGTSPAA